jgi:hypothetical protein
VPLAKRRRKSLLGAPDRDRLVGGDLHFLRRISTVWNRVLPLGCQLYDVGLRRFDYDALLEIKRGSRRSTQFGIQAAQHFFEAGFWPATFSERPATQAEAAIAISLHR